MKNWLAAVTFCSIIILILANPVYAVDCPACGAKDLPGLRMTCPECNANIYDYAYEKKGTDRSALIVKLYYTGNNPNKLSEYAKLFVNGKYMGNIYQTEKQVRDQEGISGWGDGLGNTFTALYEHEFRDIPVGQLRVEIEMRFTRLYGYGRSYKRAVFPYVQFTGKEKTILTHYFESANDFSVTDKKKKQELKKQAEEIKNLPIVNDTKVRTGSGTAKLDIGLF